MAEKKEKSINCLTIQTEWHDGQYFKILGLILIKQFTADTFSAVPGRGVYSCIASIKNAMINDIDGTLYCLQCDVKKYHPSIEIC